MIWQDKPTDVIHARYDVTGPHVHVSGATLSVRTIPYRHLAYGKHYFIKIEEDAFKNANNEDYLGIIDDTTWNFSTSAISDSCGCPDFDNCDLPRELQ